MPRASRCAVIESSTRAMVIRGRPTAGVGNDRAGRGSFEGGSHRRWAEPAPRFSEWHRTAHGPELDPRDSWWDVEQLAVRCHAPAFRHVWRHSRAVRATITLLGRGGRKAEGIL